ncbi:hypothetical protein EDC04DRAFT_312360 [Pisolithus marmoratus]|nr:hypothetical protein EDC04DRAFT_312360 [Pisolithus marmoratus]
MVRLKSTASRTPLKHNKAWISRQLHQSPRGHLRRSRYFASQAHDMNDDAACEDTDDDIDWDDDTTLLALLDDPDDSGHDDSTSVIERLGSVFASRRAREKEYIKQVMLPAMQDVKHVYEVIDQDISIRFLEGVSLFDNKARHAEEVGRREQQESLAAYTDTKAGSLLSNRILTLDLASTRQKVLQALVADLDDLIAEKDALFRSFKETLGGLVHQLRQLVSGLPGGLEGLISTLEKNAAHLGAEDHAKAKERLLRGILEKY